MTAVRTTHQRIYGLCSYFSFALGFAALVVGMTYLWMPQWLPADLTPNLMLKSLGLALFLGGLMTWWSGLHVVKERYFWAGCAFLLVGGAAVAFEIPTLPRYGMWPAEQIAVQVAWCVAFLGVYTVFFTPGVFKSLNK